MHRGYLALWRKYQDHPFWKEKRVFSKAEAWIDILWEVQHDEAPKQVLLGMKMVTCHYGESLNSMLTWGKRWGWDKSRVRRFFDLLSSMGQACYKNETVTTRLTVLNYSQYDPKRNANETQMKRKRNASETQAITDKHYKNVNNDNNIYFVQFWDLYPKKVGKGAAEKSWSKIKKKKETFELIEKALEWQIDSDQWNKNNGQYIPNPATYLNQSRWEDQPNGKKVNDSEDDRFFQEYLDRRKPDGYD